ncbi:MAG: hypothetical protein GYA24_09645 [Candidatus Lokiarchaeota archaeon]|nr:hypothetical protein [Candidatus Lokiarchaeota archaeon]
MSGRDVSTHVEYIIAGLATIAIPVLLLAMGISIPGLSIDFKLHNVPFSYNFSFYLYAAMIFAGVGIMACYFRAVRTRLVPGDKWLSAGRAPGQYRITSIPWSRIIAGALLVVVGLLSFATMGIGFSENNKIGIWLYLGGPSVSIPAGLIPLVTGVVLLLYAMAAIKVVVVQEAHGLITIRELRPLTEISTPIPARDIRLVHAGNSASGPRLLWIAFFSFQIFLLFIDGASFLGNPHAFGSALLVGGMYLLSACVQIASLILLLFSGSHSLTIITGEAIYMLQYHPPPAPGRVPAGRTPPVLERMLGTSFPLAFRGSERTFQHPVDLKRLILGISLLVIPIVSRAFNVYTGEILWFGFLVFGGILIVLWFKVDFSARAGIVKITGDAASPQHVTSNRGWFYDEYLAIPARDDLATGVMIDPAPATRSRHLLPPDNLVMIGVSLLVGLDMFMTLLLAPPGNPFTPGAIILHVGLGSGLMLLVFISSFDPRSTIDVFVAGWRFQVYSAPPVANHQGQGWPARMRAIVTACPKALVRILLEMALAFIAGVIVALIFFA